MIKTFSKMDWATAHHVAGEVCDMMKDRYGIQFTAKQHEDMAMIIQDRAMQKFNERQQTWENRNET